MPPLTLPCILHCTVRIKERKEGSTYLCQELLHSFVSLLPHQEAIHDAVRDPIRGDALLCVLDGSDVGIKREGRE